MYMRAICRTCSRLIVWRRGMAKPIFASTIWYDFDKYFYILRRKSTHIYDKMYNFMTFEKTISVGRLFTVGRTWTIKQLFFGGGGLFVIPKGRYSKWSLYSKKNIRVIIPKVFFPPFPRVIVPKRTSGSLFRRVIIPKIP